jgi:1-aminocyclopropane-1-carboxylate deaminase
LHYKSTPLQEIDHQAFQKAGVQLLVKREDLNHAYGFGNKWWKLKYNIEEAKRQNNKTLLTFGGAYSNHIYATSALAKEYGFNSIGVIRGEKALPLNPTLTFAEEQGMQLHYIDRESYRSKNDPLFIEHLHHQFGDFYLIPEGGTNNLAIKGCAEFAKEELAKSNFDYVCLPVGTGGTIAGIICGLEGYRKVVGVSVLKNGNFLNEEIEHLANELSGNTYGNWSLLTSYHHGGYAKVTKELLSFVRAMNEQHHLPLDHVYTGKLLWALVKEVERGAFTRGSTVLALHTGGLQGAIPAHRNNET